MGTTGPLTRPQAARVRQRLLQERQQARRDLAEAKRNLQRVTTEHRRATGVEETAWRRYEPYDGKPGWQDRAAYREWREASDRYVRAGTALLGAMDRMRYHEQRIAALYDPGELPARLARRAADEHKFAAMREGTTEEDT